MSTPLDPLLTPRLDIILQSPDQARDFVDKLPPEARAQVSPLWLARILTATEPDPWTHGFDLVERSRGVVIGTAGFKGPPGPDGVVELAYGVNEAYRKRGFATEAAQALTAFAFRSGAVRVVRAHTLPTPNASTRVLTKCGFRCLGEVMDPEDGPVWRWERTLP